MRISQWSSYEGAESPVWEGEAEPVKFDDRFCGIAVAVRVVSGTPYIPGTVLGRKRLSSDGDFSPWKVQPRD